MLLTIRSRGPILGEVKPPGDKSISHRALMLGAIAHGETRIRGLLEAEDVGSTAHCLQEMGVPIRCHGEDLVVDGQGEAGLSQPQRVLDAGNSGTTMRLLMGMIASYPIAAELTGDASLSKRPMDRVAVPLRMMGADVTGVGERCLPPVRVQGGDLLGIDYEMPMASAQVKSAVLLAGLYAEGKTCVKEPAPSRDHTERMLRAFGVKLERLNEKIVLEGKQLLSGREVVVPGDFSAAAYAIVAACLVSGSEVRICDVGLNPTRTGMLDVLREMGAKIEVEYSVSDNALSAGEPIGDIKIQGAERLQGTRIEGGLIPRLLDELPVLCVAAACAEGETVIRDAEELRVKESDRIAVMAEVLSAMGVDVEEHPGGMLIRGKERLGRTSIASQGDHRVAMAAAVAGLVAGEMKIEGAQCISTSYPGFVEDMRKLGAEAVIS